MAAQIRFVVFVLAPVSLIAVPLLLAHRRARRVGASPPSNTGPPAATSPKEPRDDAS